MDQISELLNRGVSKIYPSREELEKVLRSDKKITIYIGADPTAPQLHLGHSTNFIILRKLQDLGHKVIILIGDFTGMIGDPTDKSASRRQLTKEEVLDNAKTYKDQISKILRFDGDNPAEIKFNGQWLSKITPEDFINLMAMFTSQQMLERDMFQERLKENKPIYLHEFIYPIMQGYDSIAMDVDAEMGGTDQTFNMLVGRQLMRQIKNKEKFVITTELLVNPKTGKKLMSKSEGGYVGLNDPPNDMFGKIMALPDEVIEPCYRLCTNLQLTKINFSDHPMELKKSLAREITRMYHGQTASDASQTHFESVFQKGSTPTDIPSISDLTSKNIVDVLVQSGLASSKSDARRLIVQGGVKFDDEKILNYEFLIPNSGILRVGRRFAKVVPK